MCTFALSWICVEFIVLDFLHCIFIIFALHELVFELELGLQCGLNYVVVLNLSTCGCSSSFGDLRLY